MSKLCPILAYEGLKLSGLKGEGENERYKKRVKGGFSQSLCCKLYSECHLLDPTMAEREREREGKRKEKRMDSRFR